MTRRRMLSISPPLKWYHPPNYGLNGMEQQRESNSVEKITQNHILGVFLCKRFEKSNEILQFSNCYIFDQMAPRLNFRLPGLLRLKFTIISSMIANSYTMLKAPVLVWSPKWSNIGRGQYLGGWPPSHFRNGWIKRHLFCVFLQFFRLKSSCFTVLHRFHKELERYSFLTAKKIERYVFVKTPKNIS